METGVIYKVQNLENERAYIGCTRNFPQRIGQHLLLSSIGDESLRFYPELKKYPEKFYFQILESGVTLCRLRERESYWINKLNSIECGYNECLYSGNEKISLIQVNEIKLILKTEKTKFSVIAEFFNIDASTISDINCGKAWYDPSITYPIRRSTVKRKKLSIDQLRLIHELLSDTNISFSEIAAMFGWESESVIRKINAGTYSVKVLDDNSYPIRSIDSRKGSRR